VIDDFGDLDKVHLAQMPDPRPETGEVLIQVAYAGVNPADWKMCEGRFKGRMPSAFPLIPGWDVAGHIKAVGAGVDAKRIGEAVYAYTRKPVMQWGSFAELTTFEAQHVATAPKSLSMKQAAAIPLASLTAYQSVVEWGQVSKGQTVLIHAGAGGVGGMAIQFAHHHGARVITTCSPRHNAYVKQLGADIVVDYTKEKVTDQVDLVFDTVGGSAVEDAFKILRPGGRVVSILDPTVEQTAPAHGFAGKYIFVRPEGNHLRELARLFDTGAIQPPKVTEFPLEQASTALALLKEGHVEGKLVLKIGG